MIIKCKMCGGDIEFTPGETYGTCEYCGSTSTIPQAEDEAKLNRYNRANHFRRQCEFDKALAAYEKLLEQDDTDAEAHWGAVISRYGIEYVEDPATGRRVPTCHRVQVASILADADYLAAVENAPDAESRRLYEAQAAEIAEIQKGILAISANEKPYDVFICYKETDENGQRTRDSQWAQEVYYGLTEQGYKVFFSRITLEDKLGQQYEPYIFAALNSARVMVVIGSRPEYFSAVWVKNEWSRYLALMAKDRKRLLIPCYRGMDPYDLPEELSALQSQDMGKIGFMQDLLRGISKVLDAEKKPEQPQVIVQQAAPVAAPAADANLTALLKRGEMALADGEVKQAAEFFEKALNLDAEVPEAYMGKFLAGKQQPTIEAWAQGYYSAAAKGIRPDTLTVEITDTEKAHVEQMAKQCAVEGYLTQDAVRALYQVDRTYTSTMAAWQTAHGGMLQQLKERNLVRALQFATGALKARYEAAVNGLTGQLEAQLAAARRADEESVRRIREEAAAVFARADAEAERLHAEATERLAQHQASVYEQACKQMEEAARLRSLSTFREAAAAFEELGSYADSEQKRTACLEAVEQIFAEDKAALQLSAASARKRKKLLIAIVSIAFVLMVALALLMTKVIIPGNRYKHAEALLAAGQYQQASDAFAALEDYKDAASRVNEPYYVQAEALLAAGDQIGSADAFMRAGDYQDAAVRSKELFYAQAESLLADGDQAGAAEAFARAAGYQDALNQYYNMKYAQGEGAVAAGSSHTVGLKRDGTVVAVGDNRSGQCDVSGWTDIVAVAARWYHTVGLKRDGSVVSVGRNNDGQCDVSGWTDIVAVAAGDQHTVGLKRDGSVVAMGYNEYGQCNVSVWTDIVAVAAGGYHTVGLMRDGSVVAVGDNNYGQCNVSGWTDIVAIAAGQLCTVGLKRNGSVVAVGTNWNGECDVSGWSDIGGTLTLE
ncbi:MAG: TIR domain-containing protein [Eubacteriales bacterium]|nr:TIR domain-containing protein [Eubacteriales bacterium]